MEEWRRLHKGRVSQCCKKEKIMILREKLGI